MPCSHFTLLDCYHPAPRQTATTRLRARLLPPGSVPDCYYSRFASPDRHYSPSRTPPLLWTSVQTRTRRPRISSFYPVWGIRWTSTSNRISPPTSRRLAHPRRHPCRLSYGTLPIRLRYPCSFRSNVRDLCKYLPSLLVCVFPRAFLGFLRARHTLGQRPYYRTTASSAALVVRL